MELFDKLEVYTKVKGIAGAVAAGWYAQTWEFLDKCNRSYYQNSESIIPDERFDKLMKDFSDFEIANSLVFKNSPAQHVGY